MKVIAYAHQRGECMPIREDGCITRQGCSDFSGEWKIVAAVRLNNFGRTVERIAWPEVLNIKDWQFKNGAQRWFVVDFDHGSKRVWMSPTPYHISRC
jgi:hypothetical protein